MPLDGLGDCSRSGIVCMREPRHSRGHSLVLGFPEECKPTSWGKISEGRKQNPESLRVHCYCRSKEGWRLQKELLGLLH